jgi:predicted dinucleotide-binding enzyme
VKVAIIGAGNIGATLGRAWLPAHQVSFGVRSADTNQELAAAGATLTSPVNAVSSAEAVLLAVPGGAVADVLAATASELTGKIVIDATNNMGGSGPMNAQRAIAEAAPGAVYFRAFNTLGWENFAQPEFPGGERADLFYAGPDGPPREAVEALISDVGLRPVWVGDLDQVETVDAVARLWFAVALGRQHGRHTAFRTLWD